MNTGYALALLGVLGAILGAGMYVASWHRTIGLGGVALGVLLILVGVVVARTPKRAVAAPQGPRQAK